MSSLKQIQTENRRLYILKFLQVAQGYRMSDMLLQTQLTALGYGAGLDVVRGDIDWLEQQGLVTTDRPVDTMTIAIITNHGVDVACGVAYVTGIARPRPE